MRTAFRSGGISFGYRLTPWVKRLIIANAVFWLLTWTRLIPLELAVEYLGFTASEALKEPWTIITYMFVHGNFFHVFLNMLMLFFFGPPLEERWGGKEFLKYYAICGVAGALFNVGAMAFGLGTGNIPIVGASGAIYGIMLAYALNWPNSLVWIYAIFPIKVKYLVIILGAMTFFSAFGGASDGIAHFAHLGGLVVGYIYLKKGWRVQLHWEGLKKRLRKRKLTVISGQSNGDARRRSTRSDEETRMLEAVDKLLDKIAAHGIDSLTPEERRFLDDVSRRRQRQHGVRH
ncbi:MAG: rhomboid family intramembrane serine protease [Gemmatimonadetes bacterium]|uniref:Rhomboid family intramembrane serine protease n=1 Tax=Candidatus Kutchimonas denitrificans TaxID=3056748 RepID=A0AAE5CCD1_9BACT|nr:rhomboid family intramembrane serine protease [Gemmatimonadota bacterium]NIR75510.1 rhomboid family intramembrane serine protease [Candidatus Kutchimonas denitrificans]NIS01824.1 rhomboid family intramembrane serine protease [Gemmatimonadota bacterium]NIT67605.1 rhomboid family intramembrane serine protease [Gemmatimonadota bacterium]NIU53479.1 rhomboid family intramembrane serine protease [Gemmatimonadota bacterium]